AFLFSVGGGEAGALLASAAAQYSGLGLAAIRVSAARPRTATRAPRGERWTAAASPADAVRTRPRARGDPHTRGRSGAGSATRAALRGARLRRRQSSRARRGPRRWRAEPYARRAAPRRSMGYRASRG